MNNPLEISYRPRPFLVAIIPLVIALHTAQQGQYAIAVTALVFVFLSYRYTNTFRIDNVSGAITCHTQLLGWNLKTRSVRLEEFKMVRIRIHFRGRRAAGNSGIVELMRRDGRTLPLFEESIGHTNEAPPAMVELRGRIAAYTNLMVGETLVENPL